jgi:NAD(P)-dependent dehydrogenase (short-subunit alcohol dehydrogenase family)
MTEPRKILLTGATRGLGHALTLRFAELGHHVAGCGTKAAAVEELRDRLGEPPHRFRTVDVTDDDAVAAWAAEVFAGFGVPDLLLANAGVINARAPVWKVPREDFDRVIDVNVKGVANVLRHFLPPMIARGSGVVCNLSSGWGQFSAPDVGPYCASKFAIEGLTGSLAKELPLGLAAIALSPGIIHTEMLDTAFGADADKHWSPDRWVDVAAPFILALGPADNGKSVRIPGS